ncbi:MAG: SDR family NAD(P)-dependent oxidoreductase [Rhizobacter sp.]
MAAACAEIKRDYGAIHGLVHSTLVLKDQGLANMDEAGFLSSLAAKVDTSVRMAQAFGREALDFVLFFSSLQSSTKAAGQSNYAAGCTFSDAYAHALRQALPDTRVKIVNWGYWGSTGIVATPEYRQRMDRLGLGSIEPTRAMDMLDRLLAGPIDQVSYLVATRPEMADSLGVVAEKIAPVPLTTPGQPTPAQPIAATSLPAPQHDPDAAHALDRLLARLLSDRLGALRGAPLPEMYARWFAHSRHILQAHGIDQAQQDQDAWLEWADYKTRVLADPEQRASTVLVDTTLAALPQILRGDQRATEVMFPEASMALVEGIYKHNAVPDHFNAVLAEALVSYVQSRVRQQPQVKLRLVEVGAGTGGTSAMLFDKLQPYAQHIEEYCYTDISRSFLLHGQTQYGPKAPYLKTKLFDVGRALAEQGFEPGSYDVAIATNVLHATANIRRTMRNTKALLKGQGLLLLNEITGTSVFNHLTFGLLEGWWLYEDEALRVPGSPALSPEGWRSVLSSEGFHTLSYPARASHILGQQVIAGFSDGLVRQLSAPSVPLAQAPERAAQEPAPAAAVASPGRHTETGNMQSQLRARIEAGLTQLISQLLKIDTVEMERDSEFSEIGFDSISLNGFASRLNEHYGLELTPTVFFEHPTLAKLSAHLAHAHAEVLAPRFTITRSAAPAVDRPQAATVTAPSDAAAPLRRRKRGQPAAAQAAQVQPLAQEPIAIIGMSGSFPQALDIDTFWENLRAGRDCIGEIPDSRWDWSELYGDPRADGNRTRVKRAGLIEDMTEFDPLFFGISPREALGMDPQQRLLMTHVWRTIEDAGYAASALAGSDTALFVGTVGSGYGFRLLQAGMDIQGSSATGTSSTIGPNRMSYLLDLHGPSEPIDTACSSALVAIHRAVQALRSGQSALAIAGGINTLVSPEAHVSLSKAGMLCDDGRCKTFSRHADGYVRGEGVGMLMLKRLSDAERDGDRIHGLILGTAQNHGGRANSLTAPNPRAQADLIKAAFRQAGVAPGTVGYIEAHGTGTPLGDPIEMQGLKSAFMELDPQLPEASCGVGTVKTNIGHLELAAGVAGVIKVLLQMRHKTLVKSLHAEELNPYIELKGSPFYIVQEAREWAALKDAHGHELPRRAGVSSFGFGGVNAHVVLQEYVPEAKTRTAAHGPVVVVLSAKNDERLRDQALRLRGALHGKTEDDLADIAYTLQVGREAMEVRLACVVGTLAELVQKLGQYLEGAPCDELYKAEVKRHKESLAVFVADEDARELVGKWLDKGRLEKLADIWTKGLNVDWERLHREARPRRIELPTYPFAREQFWVMPSPPKTRSEETRKETRPQAPRKPNTCNVSNDALSELAYEEVWQPAAPPQASSNDAATLVCLLHASQDREAVQRALEQLAPASRLLFLETADERLEAELHSLQGTRTDAILDFRVLGDTMPRHERLIRLVQAIAQARVPVRQVLVAASSADTLQQAQYESWIGLERSLGLILPETRLSVHIEAAGSGAPIDLAEWARRLWGELGATSSARRTSTLWHDGQRHLNRAQPLDPRGLDTNAGRVLRHGGAYLITGGLGGLGLLFARHLARTHGARLLLCGRSAATPECQAQLESLRAIGAQVHYVQADVTDEAQLQRAVHEGVQRFGALHGVLHAAGLAGERGLLEMDAKQVDTLLAAKVHGTLALERAIEQVQPGQPLDFACYFSSSSAVLGDMGSGAYAIGNRFLQAHVRLRNAQHPSTRHVAIAWPLWAEGGMGLDTGEQTRLYLQSSGQGALQTEAGLRWFERFLQGGPAGPLVMVGQPSRVRRMLGLDAPAAVAAQAPATAPAPAPRRETTTAPRRSRPGRRAETRGLSVAQCLAWDLKALVSEVTGVLREQLDERQNLADVGLDSIGLAQLASRLGVLYGVELSPAIFFSHATLEQLQAYLLKAHGPLLQAFYDEEAPAQKEPSALMVEEEDPEALPAFDERQEPNQAADEAIAIIGLSGRFPGARNIDEFWQVLSQGEDRITEIPAERFDWRPYHGDAKHPGKTPGKWLAALDDVDEFDPLFFEISPLEAQQTDPRQRLLLQEAWRALEDAGYGRSQLKRERVGMFVGVEQGDYQQLLGDQGGITGNHDAILASRLAYVLNLSGPAMAINTACSSGLVAAHQACQSLRAGECDSAIAAGVNMLLTPVPFIAMGQAGMLSEDGTCRAFDKLANGLVPGEAVVALVLKRLSQAERDGDPIHGVIRGSGINYDGKTNGITAPSGAAQVRLLQDTYRRYGISPNEIGHVVTHGTGTRLGDPIEINALAEVFQGGEPGSCAITSTKPHVGHTFAASGLVSLVGLLQGMKHQAIPPSLHCEDESEYIEWAKSPFYVNKGLTAWTGAKLGAVSAFGMSGTNAHMVVQGYEAQPPEHGPVSPWHLLVLSGKSEEALRERAQQLIDVLGHKSWSAGELQAMSHTLLSGRQHFGHRVAVVVQDADDARHMLGLLRADERQAKVFKGKVTREFEAQSAMQRYGQELVAKGLNRAGPSVLEDLSALAGLYCQGYDFDWSQLFGDRPPRRIGLPTYPFARERCWIERDPATKRSVTPPLKPFELSKYEELLLRLESGTMTPELAIEVTRNADGVSV